MQQLHAMLSEPLDYGIIGYTGTETEQICSCMPVKAKIFKELYTPTCNEIAVSIWYVSSTAVVLDARLND